MASKILVSGGTGLVGTVLLNELKTNGHSPLVLTTNQKKANGIDVFHWNPEDDYVDERAFEEVSGIIHLAGAGVADKSWTQQRKQIIYDSRIKTAALLGQAVKKFDIPSFISASAVGYYGMDTGDQWMDEDSDPGDDFLADVVKKWEKAADEVPAEHVAKIRIGVVLAANGGALPRMAAPVKWGVGAPLGSGRQYMSWIHVEDLARLFVYVLEKKLSGIYNGVAPDPHTNRDFTKVLGKALNRPVWLPPVPGFLLRLVFGELALVVLGGNRVSSKKTESTGFSFNFPDLEKGLRSIYKK